jgi:hypothetical protein
MRLRRKQSLVLLWTAGMIPAGWALLILGAENSSLAIFTLAWLATALWFARRLNSVLCPRCGAGFCANHDLPYWYGLFNQRCENCGLTIGSTL